MIIDFDIPEIAAPTNPFLGYWGAQAFIGHFSESAVVQTLASTFVRCVFTAWEDYCDADRYLRCTFQPRGGNLNVSDLYRAVSRFESCITGMHLAVRSFRALRKRKELRDHASAAVINAQKPVFLSSAAGGKLALLRNKIQHIEEELAKGTLSGDYTYMIQPTGPEVVLDDSAQPGQTRKTIDRLKILEHEVLFADLADWLREMIVYVDKLRSLMPTGWSSTQGTNFPTPLDQREEQTT